MRHRNDPCSWTLVHARMPGSRTLPRSRHTPAPSSAHELDPRTQPTGVAHAVRRRGLVRPATARPLHGSHRGGRERRGAVVARRRLVARRATRRIGRRPGRPAVRDAGRRTSRHRHRDRLRHRAPHDRPPHPRARRPPRTTGVAAAGRRRPLRGRARMAGAPRQREVDTEDAAPPWRPIPLGDPTLLHSRYRAALIRHRDVLLEIARNRRTFALERTDGRVAHVRVNARQALVAAASKGIYAGETRAVVIVGFGDDAERATYFALSVPEAHELIRMVQHALDSPLPASSMTRFSSGSGRARTRRRRRER